MLYLNITVIKYPARVERPEKPASRTRSQSIPMISLSRLYSIPLISKLWTTFDRMPKVSSTCNRPHYGF
ncbi:MAG: hypothetical protein ACKPKO_64655, partial [Candidatus Fonsibacter sp.]